MAQDFNTLFERIAMIMRCKFCYKDICHLVSMVNDIHGYHLLFCSANCLCMVVTTLFMIYISIEQKNSTQILINNIVWIQYITQFGLMCWICTLTRQESDKIGGSICEIELNRKPAKIDKINKARNQPNLEMCLPFENSDSKQNPSSGHNLNYVALENFSRRNLDRDYVRKEINDFTIQLQQYRVAFTACDFFEISNRLFSGFIGFLITYLIIFIQFYHPPEDTKVEQQ
ncbi:uncharacterized protein LOC120357881 [Solenopsis invicta]|uniref:uncharacterized protein LOC120357881 n=1 Tax=Solenopsis invicta TaxID=13686 RepID=UPI00193CBADC|nr:uncharacterized protein LOC120357881 [Solenopsis invicta]